jgi:uncharacterized protein
MQPSPINLSSTVDVFALAANQGHREGCLELATMDRLAPLLAATGGTVEWLLDGVLDSKGRPAARLFLHSELTLRCDRCGKDLRMPVDSVANFWFVRSEEELDRQPVEATDEEPLIGSARFSVARLVEDELILAIPISPRHRECAADAVASGKVETHCPLATLAEMRDKGTKQAQ